MLSLFKEKSMLALLTILGVVISIKLPFLNLPFYWDEAWSYSVAIYKMYETGISMLPSALPPEVYRGHPLFYYFISATWLKIFGSSVFSAHLFSLIISLLTLVIIYLFGRKFFSNTVGLLAVLFFAFQSLFLAQAAFLLPEMLMALLSMVCFYCYFSNKKILFSVFASLLLLTKESGLVFIGTIGLVESYKFFVDGKRKDVEKFPLENWYLFVPVLVISLFFLLQRMTYGWFLFPEHVGMMDYSYAAIKGKVKDIVDFLIYQQGRNFFFYAGFAGFFYCWGKKKLFNNNKQTEIVLSFLLFTALYIGFCAVNFYTVRYLLSIFPVIMILFTYFFVEMVKDFSFGKYVVTCIVLWSICDFSMRDKSVGDVGMGYSDEVKVHQEVVNFCESQSLQDKAIFSSFLLRTNMANKDIGYLANKKAFTNTMWEFTDKTEYCVFTNIEYDNNYFDNIKNNNKLELVKRAEINQAWAEVYKVLR